MLLRELVKDLTQILNLRITRIKFLRQCINWMTSTILGVYPWVNNNDYLSDKGIVDHRS